MNKSTVRVYTRETVIRLGLQNAVLRKLRAMGCRIKAVSQDSMLTISVDPCETLLKHRQPGGISMRRADDGYLVTTDIDGCRVMWMEGAKQ